MCCIFQTLNENVEIKCSFPPMLGQIDAQIKVTVNTNDQLAIILEVLTQFT